MSAIVKGIDLDLLLEDLAATKKRVSELEDRLDRYDELYTGARVRRMKMAKQSKKDQVVSLVGIFNA